MRRPAIITFLVMAAVVFGGAIAGFFMASTLAPEFAPAGWLGLCFLPLVFIIGAQLWLGFALLKMAARFLRHQAQGRKPAQSSAVSNAVPPGSIAFVFTALGISAVTGFVLAIAPNRMGFLFTLLAFLFIGALYGVICHLLARNGYLPVYDMEGEP